MREQQPVKPDARRGLACTERPLTARDVQTIRRLRGEGMTQRELARAFGVDPRTIHVICRPAAPCSSGWAVHHLDRLPAWAADRADRPPLFAHVTAVTCLPRHSMGEL
jgi:hypothetical protein